MHSVIFKCLSGLYSSKYVPHSLIHYCCNHFLYFPTVLFYCTQFMFVYLLSLFLQVLNAVNTQYSHTKACLAILWSFALLCHYRPSVKLVKPYGFFWGDIPALK
jgi:hypothetical protein